MGVCGLVARPRVDRSTGNTVLPDGTLPLTTNHLKLHIDITCVSLYYHIFLYIIQKKQEKKKHA